MPTYQYACTQCDERLEAVQSFTDAALTECPVCGGALRKVFSAVGVVFKGSGFYKNDSRDTGKKKASATSSSGSSESASTSSSSSDASSSTSTSSSPASSGDSGGAKPAPAPSTPAKAPASKTA